jgi:hypothetical protein
MSRRKVFSILILIFLFSCQASNPETVLGIKLGLAEKSQITDAIASGKIKAASDSLYIDYGNLRGYLTTNTATNENGIEILTKINLNFVNTTFKHPNMPINIWYNEWVSENDIQYLIEMYTGKYGVPVYEIKDIEEKRSWKISEMEIKLITSKVYIYQGKIYCNAQASYSYLDEIREKMHKQTIKNNKSF